MNPIVLYVNPAWRRNGVHSPIMQPWWGNPYDKASLFSWEMFDAYSFDSSYYSLTDDISKADMVFAPYRHNWLLRLDYKLFQESLRVAKSNNLPLLVDGLADMEFPIKEDNVFILRCGGYRFNKEKNAIHVPLAVDDLLERVRDGKLEIKNKNSGRPSIGFSGWTKISRWQRLRTAMKEIPFSLIGLFDKRYKTYHKGILWRQRTIGIIKESSLVDLNLRERSSFSANPKTAEGDMRKLQEEMTHIILESDYALDVRGDGNNSARLFEILSLGRIPVIIDTERNFPFADRIDYSSFSVIVDYRDIRRLPEIIAEFHKNISPERYEGMQRNARNAFVNYFRIDAFFRHAMNDLRKMIRGGMIHL